MSFNTWKYFKKLVKTRILLSRHIQEELWLGNKLNSTKLAYKI